LAVFGERCNRRISKQLHSRARHRPPNRSGFFILPLLDPPDRSVHRSQQTDRDHASRAIAVRIAGQRIAGSSAGRLGNWTAGNAVARIGYYNSARPFGEEEPRRIWNGRAIF
jgi:hypothetical protein